MVHNVVPHIVVVGGEDAQHARINVGRQHGWKLSPVKTFGEQIGITEAGCESRAITTSFAIDRTQFWAFLGF